jgi:hypothetical protein
MANETSNAGLDNWGTGPSSARPESVGPHDVKKDQKNPAAKPMDPGENYKDQPGDNKGMGVGKDAPGGPVNIKVKE